MAIDEHDRRARRCPRLGHEVPFQYCRQGSRVSGSDCPCRKILDCWFEAFDVEEFVRAYYGAEAIEKISAQPKDKLTSIVEMIQQAQKTMDQKDQGGKEQS